MTVFIGIVLVASIIQSLLGFGYGMLLVPLGMLFFAPTTIVPVAVLSGLILNLMVLFSHRKHCDFKRFTPLLISGIFFSLIGVQALVIFNPNTIKIIVGLLMLLSSISLLTGFRINVKNEKLAFTTAGAFSGFLSGLCGIGGPPIVLFLVNQNTKKLEFKANLQLYFSLICLLLITSFYTKGLITPQTLHYVSIAIPTLCIGFLIGHLISKVISETQFQKTVLLSMAGTALFLIGQVLF